MKPKTAFAILQQTRAQILQPDQQTPKEQPVPAAAPKSKRRMNKPTVAEVATPVMA